MEAPFKLRKKGIQSRDKLFLPCGTKVVLQTIHKKSDMNCIVPFEAWTLAVSEQLMKNVKDFPDPLCFHSVRIEI